jgi:hypothetical protein
MSVTTKLRRTLALVLAGGSLAIGVPAALAAGGGEGAAAPDTGFVQDEQRERSRPDHDCPERGGDEGGGSGEEGGGSGDAGTTTPAV